MDTLTFPYFSCKFLSEELLWNPSGWIPPLVLLEKIAADDRPVNAYDDDDPVNEPVELGGRGMLLCAVTSFVDDDDKCRCIVIPMCGSGVALIGSCDVDVGVDVLL